MAEHRRRFSDTQFSVDAPLSDQEAKRRLPPHNIIVEEYDRLRSNGETPDTALRKTLELWRELWRSDVVSSTTAG